MAEQETVIRFRGQAKSKLTFWMSDKLDELLFLTGSGRAYTLNTNLSTRSSSQLSQLSFAGDVAAASSNRIKYGGSATAEANVTTSDTMTWDLIVEAKAMASRKTLQPIRTGGKDYFAMVLSTEQARDLKKDSDYINANKDGGPRGSKNPLFTGAMSTVDGVILHEHNKVINTLGLASGSRWGSSGTVHGAQALMFGSQAMGLALIGSTEMNESDRTDYGNRPGISWGRKMGMLKPQFISQADDNSVEDYGVISIKTAAAA